MSKHYKIPDYVKIALLLGMFVSLPEAYAQTVTGKDAHYPGKLSGLTYKLNNPSTITNGLVLSPNPASEQVSVRIPNALQFSGQAGCYMSVINQHGAAVIRKSWHGEKLDVSGLEPGIYIVIVNKGRLTCTQKLVVER
ncbi:T9SS type A sorting domain-containing protein [Dyadobacter sandarakinus]|uniref:T9SS type A sorting domain-containing protein n=1 Tax=Dyadobacter sandarakinus TaxID=2747268 RepID=A0ABX7IAW2_9BACT|nr:T9SS type A sorting domain-containing protein [Dyadobacter sandarakinus]QRR03266.1 T9SS type A sorting domain-containing protein [Dyadobacter sandarakinus]